MYINNSIIISIIRNRNSFTGDSRGKKQPSLIGICIVNGTLAFCVAVQLNLIKQQHRQYTLLIILTVIVVRPLYLYPLLEISITVTVNASHVLGSPVQPSRPLRCFLP